MLLLTPTSVLTQQQFTNNSDKIPQRNLRSPQQQPGVIDRRMYFAIAVSSSATLASGTTTQTYTRAFNKTLANITQSFWNSGNVRGGDGNEDRRRGMLYNITLDSLVIDLPENGLFSSNFLERLCVQLEGRRVAAILIVGDSPAAFTVALVAGNAGVPILWARGNGDYMPTLTDRVSNFFIKRIILEDLQELFIHSLIFQFIFEY